MKKLISILVALAMMMMLGVAAFAVDNEHGNTTPVEPPEYADPAAVISKYLKVAPGVEVPDATFTFTFTAADSDTEVADNMPTVAPVTLSTGDMEATALATDGNSVAGSFGIAALFTNPDGSVKFTKPGEYIYNVAESNSESSNYDEDSDVREIWTDDTQIFTVRIYVKYDGNKLVIDTITIANEEDEKLDPTYEPVEDEGLDEDELVSATFVNNYEKIVDVPDGELPPPVDPENPDDPFDPTGSDDLTNLKISKTVANGQGFVDPDAEFPYTITVNAPFNDTQETVEAFIIHTDRSYDAITITFGEPADFSLKDGEYLEFAWLPYGSTYTVTENLSQVTENREFFTPSAVWNDTFEATGSKGADLTVDNDGEPILLDDGSIDIAHDYVDFTNTLDDITVTGIMMANLPYIVLALVAVSGLVAYVVIRRKAGSEA